MRGGLALNRKGPMPASMVSPSGVAESLFAVRIRDIWKFLKAQPASFWLVCAYLFFEYVRPQSVYPSIDVLPWGKTILILSVVAFLIEGKAFRLRTPAGPLLILFAVIVFASSMYAYSPATSFAKIDLFLSWVLVYVLITNVVTTEPRFFIFILSFLLYSFKMSQHGTRTWISRGFDFTSWGATGAPGWFHNSGEFGIQMCIFLPLSIAFFIALRDRWGPWKKLFFLAFPITAVMSMIASSSRGALVGGALVLLWMVARSRYKVRTTLAAAIIAMVVVWAVPEESKDRFRVMGEDQTSVHRMTMWRDGIEIANRYPILGIGYANWRAYYPNNFADAHGLPHNIFVEAGAELGYTGFLTFLTLIGAVFWMNAGTRKIARNIPGDNRFLYNMARGLDGGLIGFIGSAFFVTVLYYPYFWIHLALTVALRTAAMDKARKASLTVAAGPAGTAAHATSPPFARGVQPYAASGRASIGQRGGAALRLSFPSS